MHCLSALKWFVYHARRYTSALIYLYVNERSMVYWYVCLSKQSHKIKMKNMDYHSNYGRIAKITALRFT